MNPPVELLERTDFFSGLRPDHLGKLARCATPVQYGAGEFLGRTGDDADVFWLIQSGRVALGFFLLERGEITVATLSEGDVAGFSWLVPPHETRFDIVATTPVTALQFDGCALRAVCHEDPEFGFRVATRFVGLIGDRVDAMNMQLLDIYGDHPIEHQ